MQQHPPKICCQKVVVTTLGAIGDDGLYKGVLPIVSISR